MVVICMAGVVFLNLSIAKLAEANTGSWSGRDYTRLVSAAVFALANGLPGVMIIRIFSERQTRPPSQL